MKTIHILRSLGFAGLVGALAAPQSAQAAALGLLGFGAKAGMGISTVAAKDSAGTLEPYLKYGTGMLGGLAMNIGAPVVPIAAEIDFFYAMRKVKFGIDANNYF